MDRWDQRSPLLPRLCQALGTRIQERVVSLMINGTKRELSSGELMISKARARRSELAMMLWMRELVSYANTMRVPCLSLPVY